MNLSTALMIAGGVVLLVLALQGWWWMRRAAARRAAEVAVAPPRVEPALAAESLPEALPGADEAPPLRTAPRRVARLDALIDAIVPLALEAPISGEMAIAHLPPSRRAGHKPFYLEGLDAGSGQWESFAPGRRYTELQAGVQLANRSGPLGEIEYSEFMQKVQAFADAVGARADAPDMLEVVARARELDGLASPLDAQLSVKLRASGVAWSVPYLQQVAQKHGFVPGSVPGRLVLAAADPGSAPLLVLAIDAQAALADEPQGSAVRECTLTLDVPQIPASAEPYPAWQQAATRLAEELDATAVDDEGRPITAQAFEAIGQELQQLYARLQSLDLAAGSPAARRLFS